MKRHTWKNSVNMLLIALMVILSVAFIAPSVADAASTPALSKTSWNILEGKKYDLNINSKIAKSTYSWTTSNKKIATVDKKGIVTGVIKGTATITCKVKAPKKTYTLTCKVTIIKPAKLIQINNKVTTLNLGQSYNLNRTLVPSTSNDKTTWTTSDAKVASPDKNGKFKALKQGTVTLTAKTLSGAKDSVTIKVVDQNGTVTNQSELNALLGSGASLITIKTDAEVNLSIPAGDYTKQKLVVDAPKADITNEGKFASIQLKQIASDTWVEKAKGNVISVTAAGARIVISSGASVSIEATSKGTVLKIENNGTVKELAIPENAQIEITGTSTASIPIAVNVPGVKIKSSVPLDLQCNVKMDLTLLKGAENTKIQAASEAVIPTITGNVTIPVKVGTGDSATTKTVTGTPIVETPGSGGGPSGPSNPGTPSSTITFDTALSNISAVSFVSSSNHSIQIDPLLLLFVKGLLSSNTAAADWSQIDHLSYPVSSSQTINIVGTKGVYSKTVSVAGGQFDGKTYTVAVNNSGTAVTISNSNVSITLTKTDDEHFSITTASTIQQAENSQILADICDVLETVTVTYNSKNYTIDWPELVTIKKFIDNQVAEAITWAGLSVGDERTYDGQKIKVTATSGTATKTLKFMDGQFAGKEFTVTLNLNSVIVSYSDVTATINRSTDNISVTLN